MVKERSMGRSSEEMFIMTGIVGPRLVEPYSGGVRGVLALLLIWLMMVYTQDRERRRRSDTMTGWWRGGCGWWRRWFYCDHHRQSLFASNFVFYKSSGISF